MLRKALPAIASVFATLAITHISAFASTSMEAPTRPFELTARMSNMPQLSRSEIEPVASKRVSPSSPSASAISYAVPLPSIKSIAAPVNAAGTTLNASVQQTTEPETAGPTLNERNVDWSPWVSKLADRWYYVLRHYEELAHVQFLTQRAALIEFTCYSNGQLGNITLKQSSGNAVYDRLQVIALMQTAPLLPFPPGTNRSSITLLQGWESHLQRPGEGTYTPGSFGKNFPTEKVREWVMAK